MSVEETLRPEGISLAVSDQSCLPSLHDWLRGVPNVKASLTPGVPASGELGAVDTVTVLASSSGLIAAIKILPDFIRSRRSGLKIETTVRGERFTLNADNVKDVIPILERLLDE